MPKYLSDKQREPYREGQAKIIAKLSNAQLFEEFQEVSRPDDYDGMHTDKGEILLEVVTAEMKNRLSDWLKN